MKTFLTRTASALVFGTLVIGSILWSPIAVAVVLLGFTILGLWEYFNLFKNQEIKPNQWSGLFSGIAIFLLLNLPALNKGYYWEFLYLPIVAICIALLFTLFIIELFKVSNHPFQKTGLTLLGVFYVVAPMTIINLIGQINQNGQHILLAFFALIWINDSMAYITGMLIGKHPFFPRISPKKTWEGTIGGAVFCILAAYILSRFWSDLSPLKWMGFGLIVTITATLGDLVESMLKRSLNVKDTGNIMPGHGGILDRFDAALFAAPFIFVYLIIFN